jgi:hypothetical protein
MRFLRSGIGLVLKEGSTPMFSGMQRVRERLWRGDRKSNAQALRFR